MVQRFRNIGNLAALLRLLRLFATSSSAVSVDSIDQGVALLESLFLKAAAGYALCVLA